MIFNKDNFFETLSKYDFEEELIKSSLLMTLEDYETLHFFIYEEPCEEVLEYVDLVFCNDRYCYNIYLILDLEGVVFDFDFTTSINARVLEEKM